MYEKRNHILNIIDFKKTQHNTIFVKVAGYDAILGEEFEGEVKFVGGMPFGDLIHLQRSSLSSECRQFVQGNLLNRYSSGDFN
ncbi:hypothetical protein R4Z09_28945 [Niallia oryzisoli]|uniref:Uncharacterized protein n=1 Tax=Niallia oryzisoli TaxID=1737571 RepID=A0ABZ2CDG7_9BACI